MVRLRKQIDEVFRPLIGPSSPGLSVIVLKNGETVFIGTYGLANLETRNAITPNTDFRLASFTKQFTAIYAAQFPGADDRKIPQINDVQILAMMKLQTSTDFPPGSRWRYGNTG